MGNGQVGHRGQRSCEHSADNHPLSEGADLTACTRRRGRGVAGEGGGGEIRPHPGRTDQGAGGTSEERPRHGGGGCRRGKERRTGGGGRSVPLKPHRLAGGCRAAPRRCAPACRTARGAPVVPSAARHTTPSTSTWERGATPAGPTYAHVWVRGGVCRPARARDGSRGQSRGRGGAGTPGSRGGVGGGGHARRRGRGGGHAPRGGGREREARRPHPAGCCARAGGLAQHPFRAGRAGRWGVPRGDAALPSCRVGRSGGGVGTHARRPPRWRVRRRCPAPPSPRALCAAITPPPPLGACLGGGGGGLSVCDEGCHWL